MSHVDNSRVEPRVITRALRDARRVARLLPEPAAADLHAAINRAVRIRPIEQRMYATWAATDRALEFVLAEPTAYEAARRHLLPERLDQCATAFEAAGRLS